MEECQFCGDQDAPLHDDMFCGLCVSSHGRCECERCEEYYGEIDQQVDLERSREIDLLCTEPDY